MQIRSRAARALALITLLAAACGSVDGKKKDAAVGEDAMAPDAMEPDAMTPDAGPDAMPIDAGPDAMPIDAAPVGEVREIISGHGSVSGGGLVLDFQLGHPGSQAPASNGTHTLEGGAAIKR